MKLLLIHGPNLNLLGQREPDLYGRTSLEEINAELLRQAEARDVELRCVQSNHEGEIVDIIGRAGSEGIQGILINPAAYTHTSVAIRDAIAAVNIPAVEVHLSNIYAREEFRHQSLIAPACRGQVSGFGAKSYQYALAALLDILHS